MLTLLHETPPAWAERALEDLPALLLDHYFLEIKAACSARWIETHHGEVLASSRSDLRALANEEEGHARRVQGFLRASGDGARPGRRNEYVLGLRRRIAASGHSLLDRLLVSALIEGRSCERFRLLSHATRGTALGGFYEDLYAAEARHFAFFVERAGDVAGGERCAARLTELASFEGQLVAGLPHGPRIH